MTAPEGPDLSIVVPTYHERANLRPLVDRIFRATSDAHIRAEVIIVDDDSQDGTEEVCWALAADYDLRLISRRGVRGLATAVIAGFQAAKGRFLVCLDADLSHPPEAIPPMYALLADGSDFVLGSRYVSGGIVTDGWGLRRRLNSAFAGLLARALVPVRDPMSGFFGLPRSTFEQARDLSPLGYKIGLELLVKTQPKRIDEMPIVFTDRQFGESKLSLAVEWEYLRHLRRLYIHTFPFVAQATQFVAVGSLGFLIDSSIYAVAMALAGMNHILARAVSFLCAATHNWFLNRRYTFVSGRGTRSLSQWVAYLSATTLGLLVNVGTYVVLTTCSAVLARHRYVAFVIGVAAGTALNFPAARTYIFGSRT